MNDTLEIPTMKRLTIAERIERQFGNIAYQETEGAATATAKEFVTEHSGTFSITVTSDEIDPETKEKKVLYKKEEEPFTYEQVDSLANVLRASGAKLDDTQIEFLNQALAGSEETGKAVKSIVTLYNAKLKADAKSSRYQALVNQYKPLEGEKKESAQARLVANFIKLAGVSKESAIEMLRNNKALPEDYTVADFDSTPLRRTKGDSDE
jgi:hypothetical protein